MESLNENIRVLNTKEEAEEPQFANNAPAARFMTLNEWDAWIENDGKKLRGQEYESVPDDTTDIDSHWKISLEKAVKRVKTMCYYIYEYARHASEEEWNADIQKTIQQQVLDLLFLQFDQIITELDELQIENTGLKCKLKNLQVFYSRKEVLEGQSTSEFKETMESFLSFVFNYYDLPGLISPINAWYQGSISQQFPAVHSTASQKSLAFESGQLKSFPNDKPVSPTSPKTMSFESIDVREFESKVWHLLLEITKLTFLCDIPLKDGQKCSFKNICDIIFSPAAFIKFKTESETIQFLNSAQARSEEINLLMLKFEKFLATNSQSTMGVFLESTKMLIGEVQKSMLGFENKLYEMRNFYAKYFTYDVSIDSPPLGPSYQVYPSSSDLGNNHRIDNFYPTDSSISNNANFSDKSFFLPSSSQRQSDNYPLGFESTSLQPRLIQAEETTDLSSTELASNSMLNQTDLSNTFVPYPVRYRTFRKRLPKSYNLFKKAQSQFHDVSSSIATPNNSYQSTYFGASGPVSPIRHQQSTATASIVDQPSSSGRSRCFSPPSLSPQRVYNPSSLVQHPNLNNCCISSAYHFHVLGNGQKKNICGPVNTVGHDEVD